MAGAFRLLKGSRAGNGGQHRRSAHVGKHAHHAGGKRAGDQAELRGVHAGHHRNHALEDPHDAVQRAGVAGLDGIEDGVERGVYRL